MSKPKARFLQCELERAERVAQKYDRIVKIVDGQIYIVPDNGEIGENHTNEVEKQPEGYL